MSTEISSFHDISNMEYAHDFETRTIAGPIQLREQHGTSKCFEFVVKRPYGEDPVEIILPKWQALLVASQIAESFGYKVTKQK